MSRILLCQTCPSFFWEDCGWVVEIQPRKAVECTEPNILLWVLTRGGCWGSHKFDVIQLVKFQRQGKTLPQPLMLYFELKICSSGQLVLKNQLWLRKNEHRWTEKHCSLEQSTVASCNWEMCCNKLVWSGLNIPGRAFTVRYQDAMIQRRPIPYPLLAMESEIFKSFSGGTHFEGTMRHLRLALWNPGEVAGTASTAWAHN